MKSTRLVRRSATRHYRRMHSLPIFLRLAGRPVILIGAGDAAEAKRRVLERAGARIVGPDDDAQIAIVALDDDREAEAAVAALKARHILVNAVDRPALCDFTLPALIDRDPVLIAIGTGGASAGLAAALRQRLELLLPKGLGTLAEALLAARAALKARWPDAQARRHALTRSLSAGGALDPLVPHDPADVGDWIARADDAMPRGLHRVTLTSDDPDDLTLGQARLIAQADCLCYAPDVPAAILVRGRADAARILCTTPPGSCTHALCVFISGAERPDHR